MRGEHLSDLHTSLLRLGPTIDTVFMAWNKVPLVVVQDPIHLDIPVRHVGDHPAKRSLYTCLEKEIARLFPNLYEVTLEEVGCPTVHVHIVPSPLLQGMLDAETEEGYA